MVQRVTLCESACRTLQVHCKAYSDIACPAVLLPSLRQSTTAPSHKHAVSHWCIVAILLSLLRGEGINAVALEKAECCCQQAGVIVKHRGEERNE